MARACHQHEPTWTTPGFSTLSLKQECSASEDYPGLPCSSLLDQADLTNAAEVGWDLLTCCFDHPVKRKVHLHRCKQFSIPRAHEVPLLGLWPRFSESTRAQGRRGNVAMFRLHLRKAVAVAEAAAAAAARRRQGVWGAAHKPKGYTTQRRRPKSGVGMRKKCL